MIFCAFCIFWVYVSINVKLKGHMGGHVCGVIFVLGQNERNTFNSLAWLRDRLSLSEVRVLST